MREPKEVSAGELAGGMSSLAKTFSSTPWLAEEPAAFAKHLRAQPGKNIWMMGGAALIGAFVDQDQIDEFIVNVMPTLIGEGIPLLGPGRREIQLSLRSCKHFSDGVVRLHYLVAKGMQGETKAKQRAV